jgi:hypothetical protein
LSFRPPASTFEHDATTTKILSYSLTKPNQKLQSDHLFKATAIPEFFIHHAGNRNAACQSFPVTSSLFLFHHFYHTSCKTKVEILKIYFICRSGLKFECGIRAYSSYLFIFFRFGIYCTLFFFCWFFFYKKFSCSFFFYYFLCTFKNNKNITEKE